MLRNYKKKAKTALNPYGFVSDNLAFPLKEGLVIVYARQSREEYYGNVSTEIQTKHMLQHAKELCANPDAQVQFIDENVDEDGKVRSVSGTWGIDKRKGLAALYEAIANGINGKRVVLVLVYAEDRMFRDNSAIEYNNYIQIALTYGVQTKVFQTGKIYNFNNQWDKKEFRLKCEWAADELSSKMLGRMLGAREYMITQGQYSRLGSLPIGLVREEDKGSKYYRKPVPYQPHAEKIKELFEAYFEKGDPGIVYRELLKGRYFFPPLAEGMHSFYSLRFDAHGARLSYSGLTSILSNPMYVGWWFDNVNGLWLKDNHPAIVESSVFWYAFSRISPTLLDGTPNPERIRARSPRKNRKKEERVEVLEGYIFCSVEGYRVRSTMRRDKPVYVVYHRRGYGEETVLMSFPCTEIDGLFLSLLREKLGEEDRLKQFKQYEEEEIAKQNGKITARAPVE